MGVFAWFNSYGLYVIAALFALYAVTRLVRARRSRERTRRATRESEQGFELPDVFVPRPTGGGDRSSTPSPFGGGRSGGAGGGAAWTALPVPIDDVAGANATDAPAFEIDLDLDANP